MKIFCIFIALNTKIIDKLKHLCAEDKTLTKVHKIIIDAFIDRADEQETSRIKTQQLIESIAHEKHILDIVLSTDDVKIYTVGGKDEWEIKYPYRCIILDKNGKWKRCSTVSPTFDIALLVYLQNKHIGENSQFADFAIKMLNINLEDYEQK